MAFSSLKLEAKKEAIYGKQLPAISMVMSAREVVETDLP